MTNTNPTAKTESGNQPDWVVKAPTGYGRNQRLERVGAAWNRDDGGICLRLVGKQVVENDLYLYPFGNGQDEMIQTDYNEVAQ